MTPSDNVRKLDTDGKSGGADNDVDVDIRSPSITKKELNLSPQATTHTVVHKNR